LSSSDRLPVTRSWTFTCWFYLDVRRSVTQSLVSMESDTEYARLAIVNDSGTWRLSYAWSGGTQILGAEVISGFWQQAAVVVNGPDALLYHGVPGDVMIPYLNTDDFVLPTGALTMYLGRSPLLGSDGWSDCRIAAVKMWDAALSVPSELDYEFRSYLPVRTDNLDRWHPLLSVDDPVDYSGNGHALTGSGSTTAEGPPLQWHSLPTDPVIEWDPSTPLWVSIYYIADGSLWMIIPESELTLPLSEDKAYKLFLEWPDLTKVYWDPFALDYNNLAGAVYVDRFDDLINDATLADVWSSLSFDQIVALRARIKQLLGPSFWWRFDYQIGDIAEWSNPPGYYGTPTIPMLP
jgi:hypothetical protein